LCHAAAVAVAGLLLLEHFVVHSVFDMVSNREVHQTLATAQLAIAVEEKLLLLAAGRCPCCNGSKRDEDVHAQAHQCLRQHFGMRSRQPSS